MTQPEHEPKITLSDLQFDPDLAEVQKGMIHYRMSEKSNWPVSLAKGLRYFSAGLPVTESSQLLVFRIHYQHLPNFITEAEEVITNGPKPASTLIMAFTHKPMEQVEMIAQDQDEQLGWAKSIMDDPSGISLLALRIKEQIDIHANDIDEKLIQACRLITSESLAMNAVVDDLASVDFDKYENIRAFAYLLAFDHFRNLTIHWQDSFGTIDKIIEDTPGD